MLRHHYKELVTGTVVALGVAGSAVAQSAFTSGGTVQPSGLILVLGQPFAATTSLGAFGIVPPLSAGDPPCAPDFNRTGALSVQDIFDFLAAYFATDPRADFNGVGGLSVQDIFDFLAAYFTGCP